MSCRVHRRYQAKRPPRVPCAECWEQWLGRDQALANLEARAAELVRPWNRFDWGIAKIALAYLGPWPWQGALKTPHTYTSLTDTTVAKLANASRSSVRRVMSRLVLAGILTSTFSSGNMPRLYRVRWSKGSRR